MAANPIEVSFVNVSANLRGAVIVAAGIQEGGVARELVRDGPLTADQLSAFAEVLHDLVEAIKAGRRSLTIHVDGTGKIVEADPGHPLKAAVDLALTNASGDPRLAAFELMRAFVRASPEPPRRRSRRVSKTPASSSGETGKADAPRTKRTKRKSGGE